MQGPLATNRSRRRIRESFARYEGPRAHQIGARADEVIDASHHAYNKWCPPRPGMVRVRMTMVEHVTREKLPKPLAALHRCTVDGVPMFSTNQRFDLGRLVVLGCPGNPNPTPSKRRRATPAPTCCARSKLTFIYARPRRRRSAAADFPDPRRGRARATTDRLVAERVFIGDKPDLISMFWIRSKRAPAACMRSGASPTARPRWCFGAKRPTVRATSPNSRPCSTGGDGDFMAQ